MKIIFRHVKISLCVKSSLLKTCKKIFMFFTQSNLKMCTFENKNQPQEMMCQRFFESFIHDFLIWFHLLTNAGFNQCSLSLAKWCNQHGGRSQDFSIPSQSLSAKRIIFFVNSKQRSNDFNGSNNWTYKACDHGWINPMLNLIAQFHSLV